jgi:hypothetical protein
MRLHSVSIWTCVAALVIAGCSSGGGGGGGRKHGTSSGTSSGSGSGSTGAGSTGSSGSGTFVGADTTPPVITPVSPGRGDMVSGSPNIALTGRATDAQSGIASVEVNGTPVTLGPNGEWTLNVTARFGTNIVKVKAKDVAGNETYISYAFLWGESYIPQADFVPDAVEVRAGKDLIDAVLPIALNAIAPAAGGLAQVLVGQSVSLGLFSAQITSAAIAPPAIVVAPGQGVIDVSIDTASLSIGGSTTGGSFKIDGTNVHADLSLDISVINGAFAVAIPSANVTFGTISVTSTDPLIQAFLSTFGPSTLPSVMGPLLAQALKAGLPPLLESAMNSALGPDTLFLMNVALTYQARPSLFSVDPAGITAGGDLRLSAQPMSALPGFPAAPGSVYRASAGLPAYANAHDFYVSIEESAIDQALFAAWQAGTFWVTIDQQFLSAYGISLPFQWNIAPLLVFFPALHALVPPGGSAAPILKVEARLPPVVEVSGAPLFTGSFGEVHAGLALDLGGGNTVDVLTVALHARLGLDAAVSNGMLQLSFGQPVEVSASILDNPLGIAQVDIDQFLAVGVPMVLQFLGNSLPPIPLNVPYGLTFQSWSIWPDGLYVTVAGDL